MLQYRPLSGLYELRNLQGDEHIVVRDPRCRAARRWDASSACRWSNAETLDLDDEYLVRINVRLDIEALPLPMRPLAYIKGDWKIASEPWEWRLRP